LYLRNNS